MSNVHYMKQHDRRPYIRAILKDAEGNAVDLTDASVSGLTFSMAKKNDHGTVVVSAEDAEIGYGAFDGSLGHCEYRWQAGETAVNGEYDAEWELTRTDGTTETFPSGGYNRVVVGDDLA